MARTSTAPITQALAPSPRVCLARRNRPQRTAGCETVKNSIGATNRALEKIQSPMSCNPRRRTPPQERDFVTNRQGLGFIGSNPAFTTLKGYTAERELRGKTRACSSPANTMRRSMPTCGRRFFPAQPGAAIHQPQKGWKPLSQRTYHYPIRSAAGRSPICRDPGRHHAPQKSGGAKPGGDWRVNAELVCFNRVGGGLRVEDGGPQAADQ